MRTTIDERKIETILPFGPVILVLLALIAVTLPCFSISRMVNGLLYQSKLVKPTDVLEAAADLERIASASFSPVDYLPVLESELEASAQRPHFMRQVVEQVQGDLEGGYVAGGGRFDSLLPVIDGSSGELVELRFIASSRAIVCQSIKQSGGVRFYWNCYSPRS